MKELKDNLKFIWTYIRVHKKSAFIYLFYEIFSIILGIVMPIIMAQMIVYFTDNSLMQLLLISILIFFLENMRNVIRYYGEKNAQIIYRETLIMLQCELGDNMLKLDNKTLDNNGSGVFIQRLTNDTSRLSDIYSRLTYLISGIITNTGIFFAVFLINKILFLYLTVEFVILYIIQDIRAKKYNQFDKEYREKSEKASGFISEMVRGARDIKMLNSEESFLSSLRNKIFAQNKARYNMANSNRKYNLMYSIVLDASDLIMMALMIYMISKNQIQVPFAIVVWQYASRVSSIAEYIGELLETIKDFNLSALRIREIIDSDNFKKEHFGKKHLNKIKGDFEFKNVSFSYNDEKTEVLNNLSFKVHANETVAFVGKSGAGKSTIFSLLAKMYDVNAGKITIDGININDLDKDSIRGNITIISQNPYIFNISIKDNFRLVKSDVSDKEIKNACRLACLDDFIESLPDKYDTIVGEGGINLSGGQRQRLAIARALVQKTEIILFDEATSALDNETQAKIQEAIANMKGEYTILIIAHRLSTIINSDRILFVEDGKIIAEGSHKELLKNNKKYKKLYENELKNK